MAKNQNPALPNRHRLYTATSGGGKTQALAFNLPKSGRVLLWDTHQTFDADHYDNIPAFIRAVDKVRDAKVFRISYTGPGTVAAFEYFCACAWGILDGNKQTHIAIDELAEVTRQGKALAKYGELLRGSRKFGGVLHISANALPEVPSTTRRETRIKWAGMQETYTDRKMLADFMNCKPEAFNDLEPLEFLTMEAGKLKKVTIKYKNPPL